MHKLHFGRDERNQYICSAMAVGINVQTPLRDYLLFEDNKPDNERGPGPRWPKTWRWCTKNYPGVMKTPPLASGDGQNVTVQGFLPLSPPGMSPSCCAASNFSRNFCASEWKHTQHCWNRFTLNI